MNRQRSLIMAGLGVSAAIAITTSMDASGLTEFSALPLLGLTIVFCLIQRLSPGETGLQIGQIRDYLAAILLPCCVMAVIAAIAYVAGAVDVTETDWQKTGVNLLLGCTIGTLMVLLTEEGFFRGWLWGTLGRANLSPKRTLWLTTVAFVLWHISFVTLDTGFDLPWNQVPVYLANVLLLGAVWGKLRLESGSVIVPSVSHAVWNAFAYSLFGISGKTGVLGIESTIVFDPEVGWSGIVLNGAFAVCLWWFYAGRRETAAQE
ncbi:MAG: CPBP family intramembrane glutamic endopeptidase [Pirellulaceae bacterium]